MIPFPRHIRWIAVASGLAAGAALGIAPALAIDPPYEAEMERLTEVLGSLYFLHPLCTGQDAGWRTEAQNLIDGDKPDDDRRQRLNGAFNTGYRSYARIYRTCTPPAREAMGRLMIEAEKTARDIHTRYAE